MTPVSGHKQIFDLDSYCNLANGIETSYMCLTITRGLKSPYPILSTPIARHLLEELVTQQSHINHRSASTPSPLGACCRWAFALRFTHLGTSMTQKSYFHHYMYLVLLCIVIYKRWCLLHRLWVGHPRHSWWAVRSQRREPHNQEPRQQHHFRE